jgi:hypothetical protein
MFYLKLYLMMLASSPKAGFNGGGGGASGPYIYIKELLTIIQNK